MIGDCQQMGLNALSGEGQRDLAIYECPKKIHPLPGDYRDEISAWLGVIIVFQTDGTAVMDGRGVGH